MNQMDCFQEILACPIWRSNVILKYLMYSFNDAIWPRNLIGCWIFLHFTVVTHLFKDRLELRTVVETDGSRPWIVTQPSIVERFHNSVRFRTCYRDAFEPTGIWINCGESEKRKLFTVHISDSKRSHHADMDLCPRVDFRFWWKMSAFLSLSLPFLVDWTSFAIPLNLL